MNDRTQPSNTESTLACTIQDPEQLRQRTTEVTELLQQAEEIQELADGFAFRFANADSWATQLLEFILFEKNCCPFFTFEMTFEAQHGPLWLRLRGADGVKEIAQGLLLVLQGRSIV